MTSTIDLPVRGEDIALIPQGKSTRPVMKYQGGVRTDFPETNEAGEPLHVFTAVAQHNGADLGSVSVRTPVAELPPIDFGTVLTGVGHGLIRVGNDRNAFDLRITVTISGLGQPQAGGTRTKGGE